MSCLRSIVLFSSCTALACQAPSSPEQEEHSSESETSADSAETGEDEGDGDGDGDGEGLELVSVTHDFGEFTLQPFQEINNCVQWTVENDEALYVQSVTLSNLGYFHHSNWFVVPEDMYEGPDGFFKCSDRGFDEVSAAIAGTVLFAQSTQSFVEQQRTRDGAVIKIPPRHKVVAGTHLLNVGPAQVTTQLFMSLDLVHPREVDVILTPFRLSYLDLDIPALSQSHFTGVCGNLGERYQSATGKPIDIKLHYVLPHYHYLGNYFNLTFEGGDFGGEPVYVLDGFNGEANGRVFNPPLDLTGVTGVRYTCGYDNWRDVNIGWGNGDQEMCVMLGLAESRIMFDGTVTGGTAAVGMDGDIIKFEGTCALLTIAKNPAQSMPTKAEKDAPLYVPPGSDSDIPPVPECIDHDPKVGPTLAPTLSNMAAVVFAQSCSFNACHGAAAAAGLNLTAPNLHAELLGHTVVGKPGATLVEPGDPEGSWLYQMVAKCTPEGGTGSHMPLNSPVLLDDRSIALVREWIAAGALDN